MKVVVLSSFRSLGSIGSLVDVAPGYAKNYLVPRGVVAYATKAILADLEAKKAVFEKKNTEMETEALKVKASLSDAMFFIIRAASDDGRLYGAVKTKDVLSEVEKRLSELGLSFEIARGGVDFGGLGVKTTGIHSCRIVLHGDVFVEVSLNVCRTVAEGEALLVRLKKSSAVGKKTEEKEDEKPSE